MVQRLYSPLFLAAIFATSCQGPDSFNILGDGPGHTHYTISEAVYATSAERNPNTADLSYVSIAVPFRPILALKSQVEAATGLSLRDRGEAHITVVTPPEEQVLRARLSGSEILAALGTDSIQQESFKVTCLGHGLVQAGHEKQETFYAVIYAPGLVARRAHLAAAFRAAGGSEGGFDPAHFYPHITVGFTHGDLHEQDGVVKDRDSCIGEIAVRN